MSGSTPTIDRKPATRVAIAVIVNERNDVLIGKRADNLHLGGYWEFPGGKLEPGETAETALAREVLEETGLTVTAAQPLIEFSHSYPSKQLLLSVYKVETVTGQLCANDHNWQWVDQRNLLNYEFPAANQAILKALNLAPIYAINGGFQSTGELVAKFQRLAATGVSLACFRAPLLSEVDYIAHARQLVAAMHSRDSRIVLNAVPNVLTQIPDAAGLHLNSRRLLSVDSRPIDRDKLLLASCHNERELEHACRIGADAVVLSPVHTTTSHPEAPALGWAEFQRLVALVNVPVYALGGMQLNDIGVAQQMGGQGIAGIGAFWSR